MSEIEATRLDAVEGCRKEWSMIDCTLAGYSLTPNLVSEKALKAILNLIYDIKQWDDAVRLFFPQVKDYEPRFAHSDDE
jgi:hypothetical protein